MIHISKPFHLVRILDFKADGQFWEIPKLS